MADALELVLLAGLVAGAALAVVYKLDAASVCDVASAARNVVRIGCGVICARARNLYVAYTVPTLNSTVPAPPPQTLSTALPPRFPRFVPNSGPCPCPAPPKITISEAAFGQATAALPEAINGTSGGSKLE